MEAPVLIHLLGVVRSSDGSTERVLSGVQPRTVLVLTALRCGRPVTADELAEALWPDGPGRHWNGALRGVVSKVRFFLDALGPSAPHLDNVGHGYCFTCPDTTCVDVQRAGDDLAEAERLLAVGSAQDAAVLAERAVRLLDAPLLPDVDGEWLARHRAELLQQLLRALRVAAAAESARGRHDDAVRLAVAAVDRDPLDESSHRALMEAHRAAGNRAAALRAYGACRTVLADELGVTPSEETERCYVRLLGSDATSAPSVHGLDREGAVARPTHQRPFVGRGHELARLSDAWAVARTGQRQIVLLRGDAGAGKTRLSLEAADRAGPTHVLYGRASPEQVIAFEPFTEAIGRHLTHLDDDRLATVLGDDGPVLAAAIPAIAGRGRIDPGHRPDGDERQRALESVRSVLGRIAAEPTVLVIDDLHWADSSTLLLLRGLLRTLDAARLLVLATYRDDDEPDPALSDALTHLHRMDGCHTLRLAGLDPADVSQLLAGTGITDGPRLGPILHERTGGNPFYLTQVLSVATERPERFDPLEVPDTVSELIRHRVVSLPSDARAVLALAATIGTTVERDLLTEAMRIDGCEPAAIDVLVDRHLLLEVEPDSFTFAHALARDAIYGQLPRARRRRLHLSVALAATALAGTAVDRAATMSHHFLMADDPAHARETVDATLRAARHSSDVLAYERAIEQYSSAVSALDRFALEDPRESMIRLGLGAAHRRVGDHVAARAALETAVALARAPGQEHVFAEAVLELVAKGGRGVAMDMSDPDRADLLAEAADRLDDGEEALRVSLLAEQALALLLTDQADRRHAAATAAHHAAMDSGRPEVVARGVVAHRLLLSRPDGAAARLAHTHRLVGPHRHHVEPEQLARIHLWRLTDCFELGDRPGVERELAALCDQARSLGQPYWLWLAQTWQALHAWVDGDDALADELAAAALDHVAALDHPETMLAYGLQLVGFRLHQGRGAEILDLLASAAATNPAVPAMRCTLAFALAQAGDEGRAGDHLRELSTDDFAAIPDDSNWAVSMASLAETAALLDHRSLATSLLPLLEPYRDRFVVVSAFGAGGLCWGPYSATLASLRNCSGDPAGAQDDLDDALAAVTAFGSPPMCRRVVAQRDEMAGRHVPVRALRPPRPAPN